MYVRVILCVKLVYIQSARYVKRLKGALHSGRRAPAKRKKSNCIEFDGDTGIWGVGSGFEPTFGGTQGRIFPAAWASRSNENEKMDGGGSV